MGPWLALRTVALCLALAAEAAPVPTPTTAAGPYEELARELLAAEERIRTYGLTLETTRRVPPRAKDEQEARRAAEGLVVMEQAVDEDGVQTATPADEWATKQARDAYQRELLEGWQTSSSLAMIGQVPGRSRITTVREAGGQLTTETNWTDGATFSASQTTDPTGMHEYQVVVDKPRASVGSIIGIGYPYSYWLAKGEIVGVASLERGLERLTITLADGTGTVLIDAWPDRGHVAVQVQVLDAAKRLTELSKAEDLREFGDIWFPQRVIGQEYRAIEGQSVLKAESVRAVKDLQLNLRLIGTEFELTLPANSMVTDKRQTPFLNYETDAEGKPVAKMRTGAEQGPPG